MNESQIMKLSLIGSIIGIIALYFVAITIEPVHVNIDETMSKYTSSIILVNGIVSDIYLHEDGHIFFTLSNNTGEIKVVLWKDTVKQLKLKHVKIDELKNGDHLEITGTVEYYKGELEFMPLRAQVKFV